MDSIEEQTKKQELELQMRLAESDKRLKALILFLGSLPTIGLAARLLQATQGFETGKEFAPQTPPPPPAGGATFVIPTIYDTSSIGAEFIPGSPVPAVKYGQVGVNLGYSDTFIGWADGTFDIVNGDRAHQIVQLAFQASKLPLRASIVLFGPLSTQIAWGNPSDTQNPDYQGGKGTH